jgi:hypothetical protein
MICTPPGPVPAPADRNSNDAAIAQSLATLDSQMTPNAEGADTEEREDTVARELALSIRHVCDTAAADERRIAEAAFAPELSMTLSRRERHARAARELRVYACGAARRCRWREVAWCTC